MMTPEGVAKRAGLAASVFDTVAWVVLVVGVVGAVAAFFVGIGMEDGFAGVALGLAYAVWVLVYTVILWAGITLSTAVAGYIANRSGGAGDSADG